jgi:hydroxyethylthiazole kinase-like uncharacterized protein yjeF
VLSIANAWLEGKINDLTDNPAFLKSTERAAVTSAEMRAIEDRAAAIGISKLLMMENAGSNVARFIVEHFAEGAQHKTISDESRFRIVFIAGTGNNGGDALVAARHLNYWSHQFAITLFLIGTEENLRSEEAACNWRILKNSSKFPISEISSAEQVHELEDEFSKAQATVIALFGTGFKGTPRSPQKEIIELINSYDNLMKISVDVPSGLDSDTGDFTTAVRSEFTITMHSPKVGMIKSESAKQLCGKILVANIGIPF